MKILKKVSALGATVSSFAMSAGMVLAQGAAGSGQANTAGIDRPEWQEVSAGQSGFLISDFGVLLQGLLNVVLFISALLVFAYLVWGGVQWITSGGDKGKTEEARNKITAAIIGLAVVAASYAVFQLVLYVIGIDNPFTSGLPDEIRLYR
jgi:hypothetical protein